MSRSEVPERAAGLPPRVNVIRSAVHAAEHDPDNDRGGEADALIACGHLATLIVPARGALAPADDDLFKAINAIASEHLGFSEARKSLCEALERIQTFEGGMPSNLRTRT